LRQLGTFEDAMLMASELHKDHTRKGSGIPYITHLMGVASLAMEASVYSDAGSTSDIGIGALLHDAIEDQGHKISLEEIESKFGTIPARIVKDCTDTDVVPKPPWKARKQTYIDKIGTKARASQLVSTADKLHNTRAILYDFRHTGHDVFSRFSVDAGEVAWYYKSLLQAFEGAWRDNPLVPELKFNVEQLVNIVEDRRT